MSAQALTSPKTATVRIAKRELEMEHAETLHKFAYFPYRGEERIPQAEAIPKAWPEAVASLARLAEPEDWTGTNPEAPENNILNNFLRFTYKRHVMEGKIAVTPDGGYAAFNTGLLTKHIEEIFGFFSRNTRQSTPLWVFQRWVTESDRDLLRHFGTLPEMPEFVRSTSDLVYDWRRDLKLSYDHIIDDNLERFPQEIVRNPIRARAALRSAVDETLKRVRRNYKLAVPQWYPKVSQDGAQFLLPIDLTGSGSADLALVVSAVNDRVYRGHTVLTLGMAYSNARLIARPDSDWLKPGSANLDDELSV